MRRVVIICLLVLIGHMGYGQGISKRVLYSLRLSEVRDDRGLFSYRTDVFKLTIKTMLDLNELNGLLDDEGDYMGIGQYDIRMKFYASSRLSFIYRVVTSDLLLLRDKRQYLGFVYKF